MKKLIKIPDNEVARLKREAFDAGLSFSAYCTWKISGANKFSDNPVVEAVAKKINKSCGNLHSQPEFSDSEEKSQPDCNICGKEACWKQTDRDSDKDYFSCDLCARSRMGKMYNTFINNSEKI